MSRCGSPPSFSKPGRRPGAKTCFIIKKQVLIMYCILYITYVQCTASANHNFHSRAPQNPDRLTDSTESPSPGQLWTVLLCSWTEADRSCTCAHSILSSGPLDLKVTDSTQYSVIVSFHLYDAGPGRLLMAGHTYSMFRRVHPFE